MFNDKDLKLDSTNSSLPTVLFIHSLNLFGMANSRRVNENNVDLNRNALFTEEDWERVLNRDKNIAGYEDFYNIFNPKERVRGFAGILKFIVSAVKI